MAMRLLVAGPELHSAERLLGCRCAIEAVFLGHGSGNATTRPGPARRAAPAGERSLKAREFLAQRQFAHLAVSGEVEWRAAKKRVLDLSFSFTAAPRSLAWVAAP